MAENIINSTITNYQSKILFDKHRFAMFYKGRRGGGTRTGIIRQCIRAMQTPDFASGYYGLTATMTKKTAYKEAVKFIPPQFLDLKKCSKSNPPQLVFKNGSYIDFWSTGKMENLRGDGYNEAFIDEIQNQPDGLLEEIVRPMVSTKKGNILAIGTTQGTGNWSYDLTNHSEWYFRAFDAIKMGVIPLDEIESLRKTMDDRTFRQEIMAEFVNFAGAAYYEYKEENITTMNFNSMWDTVICFDFNVNPMTCTIVQMFELNKWVCTKGLTLYNSNTFEMCDAVKAYLNMNQFQGNLWSTGDYAGTHSHTGATANDWKIIDSYFSMFRNYKHKIRPTQSVSDRISATNIMLKNKTLLVNKEMCQDLHEDFVKTTRHDNGKLNDNGGKRTHWTDGVSYLAYNWYPVGSYFSGKMRV